jgi:RNA 3'-terminal phosphate cyclase
LLADKESTIILKGGTHNMYAPPYDFLAKAFLPILNRMGAKVELKLDRYGFFPKGGGVIKVKWSDLPYSDSRKLKSLIEYTKKKNNLNNALVTSKTISEKRIIDDVTIKFQPSAVYIYGLGKFKSANVER